MMPRFHWVGLGKFRRNHSYFTQVSGYRISMLDAIRKRSGSIVVKVLLLLLVLSFGAWGIGDYIRGGVGNQSVATVGDRKISTQAFSNEFQREMNRFRQLLGSNLDTEMARSLGIQQSVLNRMIRSEIFAAAAQDFGLLATDEMVRREIQSMDVFRGITGDFDKDTFRQALNNAGYSEEMFIALMRGDLNRNFLLGSFENGASAPDVILKAVYGHREEARAAEIVFIPDDAFVDVAEPTDQDVATYHQEHSDQFMAPDYRGVSYLYLSADDLAQEISVSEEEILEAYAAREGEFVNPARRNVEQAIFASVEAANAALELLSVSGRSFADVAGELTQSSADALSLGWVGQDDFISAELADAAFSLGTGGISAAIESPLGWHVLHVIEAEDETRQLLDAVRMKVRDGVARDKAVDSLFTLANALEDEMGGGATLEEASRALDLPLARIDGVDANGLNPAGIAVDVPTDNFLQAAFATLEGDESPLTESANDSYFMVRVNSITDSVLRPLDSVRDAVRVAMMSDRRRAQAEEAAMSIIDAVNSGTPLLDALSQVSFSADMAIVNAPSFKRNGNGAPEEMPAALSSILFDAAVGQGGYARAEGGVSGGVVGRVSSVTPADFSADPDAVDALNTELLKGIRSDLMDQLATALQDTYAVSVNENVLDQLF